MEDQLRSMSLDSTPKIFKIKKKKKKKKNKLKIKVEEDTESFASSHPPKVEEDTESFASSHPPKVIDYFRDIIRENLPSRERKTFNLSEVYDTCVPLIEVEINEKKGSSEDAKPLIRTTILDLKNRGVLESVYPNTKRGWYRWIPNTQYIDKRQHGAKEKIYCKYCAKQYERPKVLSKHEAKCDKKPTT